MNIKGILTRGILFNGILQKDFEIRQGTIGDIVELYDSPMAERCEKNFTFQQIALIAVRLVRLGDIPKVQITPELLMWLTEADYNVLYYASRGAVPRAAEAGETEPVDDDSGADEAGLQPGRDKGAPSKRG